MNDDRLQMMEQQRLALDASQRLAFKAWETTAKLAQCNLRATNSLLPSVLPWAGGGATSPSATSSRYDPAAHMEEVKGILQEAQSELTRIGTEQAAATLAVMNDVCNGWFSQWASQAGSAPFMGGAGFGAGFPQANGGTRGEAAAASRGDGAR